MKELLISVAMQKKILLMGILCLMMTGQVYSQSITYNQFLPESTVATEEEQIKLMNWLDEDFHRPATLLLRASEDGISSGTFWTQCADIEHTIVIVKSVQNAVFGGYNSGVWEFSALPEDVYDLDDNFLFTMSLDEVMPANPGAVHIHKVTQGPAFGPSLGFTDFRISNGNALSYVGSGYDCPTSGHLCGRVLNDGLDGDGGSSAILLIDYEVWQLNSDPCIPKIGEEVAIDTNGNGIANATDNCFDPMFTGSEIVCETQDAQLALLFPEHLRNKGTRVYSSEIHGTTSADFFNQVNGLDNSILLIKTTEGEIIGGYNKGIWSSQSGSQYELFDNFLFNLNGMRLHYARNEEVPHITTGPSGPQFGTNDLRLGNDLTTNVAFGYLGGGYQYDSNSEFNQGEYQYIDGDGLFTPEIVEVWKVGGDPIIYLTDNNNNGICDYLEIYDLPVPYEGCVSDINNDGTVTAGDLTIFLTAFGTECD